jgi:phosphomannomutase
MANAVLVAVSNHNLEFNKHDISTTVTMTLPLAIVEEIDRWLRLDRNPATRHAVASDFKLAQSGSRDAVTRLSSIFSSKLEFGTAGLRGAMGPGTSRLNDLTVIQAVQGIAAYLRHELGNTRPQVVIGYDGRHNSSRFAQRSASVLRHAGVEVLLFPNPTPTPMVPFAVRHLHLDAGIMVTASHNPKNDNGVKVYGCNGAQIISPVDELIAAAIEKHRSDVADGAWSDQWKQCRDPTSMVVPAYFSSLAELAVRHVRTVQESNLHITYTAMHGVGGQFAVRSMCEVFGLPAERLHVVTEQFSPDPEFSTVKFPNPEEGKESLDLALQTADRTQSSLILANDPDADRLAVAERQSDGKWKLFTGDELGAVLGWWCLEQAKATWGQVDENVVMLSSAVSSNILGAMAKREGFRHVTTLTGFKWMGSHAATLTQRDARTKIVFAYEEAIGFMIGSRVFDKDGITAAGVIVALASSLARDGQTLTTALGHIYAKYGYHATSNSYMISPRPATTLAIFERLSSTHPRTVANVAVTRVRDLISGADTGEPSGRATLPTSRASPMITLWFANGVVVTVRGSGTEPKVKWYAEQTSKDPIDKGALNDFVAGVVEELLQPTTHNLSRRSNL